MSVGHAVDERAFRARSQRENIEDYLSVDLMHDAFEHHFNYEIDFIFANIDTSFAAALLHLLD